MPPKKSNKPVEDKPSSVVVEDKPSKSQKQSKKGPEPEVKPPVEAKPQKGKGKKVEEKPVEKPTKGGKKSAKKEEPVEKPEEKVVVPSKGKAKKVVEEKPSKKVAESTEDSDDQFKKWKDNWATAVAKITEHQKITQKLEEERDELVKKMENYLAQKKGTLGENILENTSKLKKTITKVDVNVAQIDDNSDSDSDTTDDDDDDEDDEDDEDATPAVPLKKGKAPAKFVAKKGVVQEDSDSDDDSE